MPCHRVSGLLLVVCKSRLHVCVKWTSVYVCNRIHQTSTSLTEHMTPSFNKFTMRKEKRSPSHVLGTVFHPSVNVIVIISCPENSKRATSQWDEGNGRPLIPLSPLLPPIHRSVSALDFLLRHCVYSFPRVYVKYFLLFQSILNTQNEPFFPDKSRRFLWELRVVMASRRGVSFDQKTERRRRR